MTEIIVELKLLSRHGAQAAGLLRYFTGRLCKYDHLAERHTSTGICLECGRMHKANAYHRDIEKARQKGRDRIASNPQENRDRVKAWREVNPEKKKAAAKRHYGRARLRKKAYRVANKERIAAYLRTRYLANKDRYKAHSRTRKARKQGAEGKHSPADITAIMKAQRNRCAYCRVSLKGVIWHVDHITALARGGSNWPSNLQITCKTCNLSKRADDPIHFAQKMGMLL